MFLQVLELVKTGDSLVVWKLDRLSRSMRDLVNTSGDLRDRGINLVSITENIDTSTPGGKCYFGILAALAELQLSQIRERTKAGIAHAKANGRLAGRPKTKPSPSVILELVNSGRHRDEICQELNISRSTLQRAIATVEKNLSPAPALALAQIPRQTG